MESNARGPTFLRSGRHDMALAAEEPRPFALDEFPQLAGADQFIRREVIGS